MGIKRKSHFKGSQEAVSEIIGTLLILAITVILFSTVLFYVAQIPPPHQNNNIDFGTEPLIQDVYLNGTEEVADTWINITMRGGEKLYETSTSIVLIVNENTSDIRVLKIAQSTPSIGNDWGIGEAWCYELKSIPVNSSVRALIIDSTSSSVIWESELPLPIQSIPVFGDRGTNPSIPVIDENATIWCYVYDSDGYLTNVWVDLTGVGSGIVIMDDSSPTPNLWTTGLIKANANWTTNEGILHAVDNNGNSVQGRISLSAVKGEESGDSGDTGYEPKNIIYSKSNGFNIFNRDDWDALNFEANPCYNFVLNHDEAAVVVVSKSLLNTDSKNQITVIRADTKEVVYEIPNNAFTRYRYTSGYYSYKAYIDISSPKFIDDTKYIVQIRLEDNSNPTNKIFINNNITTGTGGPNPSFMTFGDSAYTTRDNRFYNNEIFYVKIQGSGLPANAFFAPGGEVIIRDFVGGTQIKTSLPTTPSAWNGPVSGITWNAGDSSYRFAMNLTAAKAGSPWIPGGNQAYAITFDMFTMTNGTSYDQYYLTGIVYITSPVFSGGIAAGIVQGCTPLFGQTQGVSAWTQSTSMLYYVNDNTWTPPEYMEPFNQWSDYRPQCLLTTSGDMNGDGVNNEVVSYLTLAVPSSGGTPSNAPIYYSYWVPKIVLYQRDDQGGWSALNIKTMSQGVADGSTSFSQVKSLAIGNIDKDDDKDVVFGMSNGTLAICRNDGFWSYKKIADFGTTKSIISLAVADLDPASATHDRNRSLDIVVGCSDGSVMILRNSDGMGSFSVSPFIVTTGGLKYVTSLTIGDLNNDGLNDLVVVGGTGANGYVCVGYNDALQGAGPTVSAITGAITAFNSTNAPKTNVTLGNYMTKDNYPDIAIAVGGKNITTTFGGVWIIKHTYSGAHIYDVPNRVITDLRTEAAGSRCDAKIQCMISVDIDNDGLLDIIIGTGDWMKVSSRNEWRGNVLIFLNKDGTGAFARYVVDNTGVPVRAVTVTI